MKRFIAVLLTLFIAAALFAAGGQEGAVSGGSITLLQNKPEIDAQLKAYAAIWSKTTGIEITIKSCGGGNCEMGTQLRADYAAGDMPDLFVIAGVEDYKEWESIIADLSGEQWLDETAVAFEVGGKTYGFPVAVEGWGMAYNADVLKAAGVDPASLVNYAAYKSAFEQIDSMKDSLGLDSVVSMAASLEMKWVTAHHNFNSLLSNGLSYGDLSVTNALLEGKVDKTRLSEYADWVELLFTYADQAVLTTGNYDSQVGAFATGKAAFLHQGNWTDPNMASANASFDMAFAPHGSMKQNTDGIFVAAPSYYVVNKDSEYVSAAKKFLNDLVYSDAGQNYMVNEAGMIPAYANVSLQPSGKLSKSVQAYAAAGKVYSWNQYYFTNDFRDQTLGPIYNQFATGQVDKSGFVDLMIKALENREM